MDGRGDTSPAPVSGSLSAWPAKSLRLKLTHYHLVGGDARLAPVVLDGASRTRTDDLSAASRTLSQLSYSPRKL